MNIAARNEAVAVIGRIVAALVSIDHRRAGAAGAAVRQAIGDLAANADAYIVSGNIGGRLAHCFNLVRAAGATVDGMAHARAAVSQEAPEGVPAIAIVNGSIRFCLINEARIAAATTFASRDDVNRVLDRLDVAFDAAEIVAANSLDATAYRAIVSLHAAVAADLTARARKLPRIVTETFPARRPALWLANRLYGDASRADELIAENKPVHPAFVPQTVRVLAN